MRIALRDNKYIIMFGNPKNVLDHLEGCSKSDDLLKPHVYFPHCQLQILTSVLQEMRINSFRTTSQIDTTKIDGVVCTPNIPETVAGRLMKFVHRPPIASTMIKLISKPFLLHILLIF